MPIRSFGIQTIASTASAPVFGTTLAAAGDLVPDPYTGKTDPASNQSLSYFSVASITGFRKGDSVVVGPKNKFILGALPGTLDVGTIYSLQTGTPYPQIVVQGLVNAHASGEYLLLAELAADVRIVPVTLAAVLYLGNASTVAVGDPSTFDVIPAFATGNPYFHESPTCGRANSYNTSEYWYKGTTSDTFVARFSTTG